MATIDRKQILISTRADQRAYPDDDDEVHRSDERSEQPIHHRPGDQQVYVVQAATQDSDPDGDRDGNPSDGRESCARKVEQARAKPEFAGKQQQPPNDGEGASVGEPLELLTLDAPSAPEPQQ